MNPAQEAAYLRALAAEIAADHRYGPQVRLITPAVLVGRAARIEQEHQ